MNVIYYFKSRFLLGSTVNKKSRTQIGLTLEFSYAVSLELVVTIGV